jgi:hypothetical protein
MDSNDPNGKCLTCQAVSKQKIHTLPCRRYMITECTLFRTGTAPGMEFTFRWPVMKLKDISDWAETEVRTISIKSDVCPIPLDVSVRKFVPIPQDSLHKGWMDGKAKKFKEVTPFAIVNMSAAVKDMREHINTHVFQCMAFFLEGRDTLIRETYAFARQYMTTAVSYRISKASSAELLLTDYSLKMKGFYSVTSSGCGLQFVVQLPLNTLWAKTPSIWSRKLKIHLIPYLERSRSHLS